MAQRKRKLSDVEDFDFNEDDEEAVEKLREIFPNAPLTYLRNKVANHRDENIQTLVTQMLLNSSVDEHVEDAADDSVILVPEDDSNDDMTDLQRDCLNQLKDVLVATATSLPDLTVSRINELIAMSSLEHLVKQLPVTETEVWEVRFLPNVSRSHQRQLREVILTITREFNSQLGHEDDVTGHDDSSQELNSTVAQEETAGLDDSLMEAASGSRNESSNITKSHPTYMERNISMLSSVFPSVDPDFIKEKSAEIGDDQEKLESFITSWLDKKSGLPSRKEYDMKMAKEQETRKIRKMTPMDFISQFEDPHGHFMDTSSKVSKLYKDHAIYYLHKHFPTHTVKEVEEILKKNNDHFLASFKELEKTPPPKKGKKIVRNNPVKPQVMDSTFLKEYIYFKLESKIKKKLQKMKDEKEREIAEARKSGGLFECQCCFDSEILLREVVMCDTGCMLCPDCVRRGAGVQIGDGKSDISCLGGCGLNLPMTSLQSVLTSKLYDQLVRRKQLAEVAAAGLEDLVQCPACNFATIMPDPEDKILRCDNEDCKRETCRLCGEESHVPLACNEVEKDNEVKLRTRLEDAMTEAMVRECVKCNKRFFKEEGCNKMHCECGQSMCYLCRKPVPNDYTHFYGEGASPVPGKCPLWSENENLHKHEINKAVEEAKKKINFDDLKNDPTKHLEKPRAGFDPKKIATPRDVDLSDNSDDEDLEDDDDGDLSDFITSSDDEYDERPYFLDILHYM